MSETVTLLAGILLTFAGLLALAPFVPRLARRAAAAPALDYGRLGHALAAAGSVLRSEVPPAVDQGPERDGAADLPAQLFDLRMTVSDLTAELQAAREAIAAEAPEADIACCLDETPELDTLSPSSERDTPEFAA